MINYAQSWQEYRRRRNVKTSSISTTSATIFLGLCFPLCVACLAQTPSPIIPDYDVSLEGKDAVLSVTAAAATLQDELWLGVHFIPNDLANSRSHLWKLDKYGKRIVDIEIRHPDTWGNGAKGARSSVAGIALTAEGPKIYVAYDNPSEFWAVQLDNTGGLLRARKIVSRSEEASGGIYFSPDLSEAVINSGALELSHLNKDDRLDWTIQLPMKEDEGVILCALVNEQIFVTAFSQKNQNEKPSTQVFSYDRRGKLLQKATLPELNIGLSFVDGSVQLFNMSTSKDTVAVVLLDPKSLQIHKQSVIPNLHNFVALLKAWGNETALLVSRKEEAKIGVLVLDRNQQQDTYRPLDLDFNTGYLITTVLGKIFIAGNTRIFMLAPAKVPGTIRVISFSLPGS
jgi:hypothetical protein